MSHQIAAMKFGISVFLFSLCMVCPKVLARQEVGVDESEPETAIDGSDISEGSNSDGTMNDICEPKLDMLAYIRPQKQMKLPAVKSDGQTNFAFKIADIDMPIQPPNGTLKTALQILASWGSIGDELSIPIGETEKEAEQLSNVIQFRNNQLNIDGLNLSMLNVHLYTASEPKFALGVHIKNTRLTGEFAYYGPQIPWASFPISGYYRMSISDIMLVSASNLTKLNVRSKPQLQTNNFVLNITNIGYIDIDLMDTANSTKSTSNSLLQMVRRLLLMTVKRTYYTFEGRIRDTLEREGRRALDCELTRFSESLDSNSRSIGQNDLAKIIRAEIERSNVGSVPLPDYQHKQSILGSSATINFYNGTLSGLNNFYLDGETRIKLENSHLLVNTSVAWRDLNPYYSWNLTLGSRKTTTSKGFVSLDIKTVYFDAIITRGLDGTQRYVVDQLAIETLDNPRMDVGGLPGMNRVTRGIVNFFMGRLKQRVMDTVQPALKSRLEMSLNKARF